MDDCADDYTARISIRYNSAQGRYMFVTSDNRLHRYYEDAVRHQWYIEEQEYIDYINEKYPDAKPIPIVRNK